MNHILQAVGADLANLSERVQRSLVQIRNGRQGVGAGTIWHAEGLIVTNAHVLHDGPLSVTLADGRSASARLLAHDRASDLAALRVDLHDLPTIELGDSRTLRPGAIVLSMGHPFGVAGAVTVGVVISAGKGVADLGGGDRDWITASLHLRPGHSGGPMVDTAGRLVGINTLMNGPDVGVAVPVHVAKRFLKEALTR